MLILRGPRRRGAGVPPSAGGRPSPPALLSADTNLLNIANEPEWPPTHPFPLPCHRSRTPAPPWPTHVCDAPPTPLPLPATPAGLVAQQQCVGPLQLPISDVAVFAQSHQDLTGLATSIGEQPIKGLIDPVAMARLSLGEALTNLVSAPARPTATPARQHLPTSRALRCSPVRRPRPWLRCGASNVERGCCVYMCVCVCAQVLARATSLPDVRASVNWMYAAKMKSEGAAMYDAAISLRWVLGWFPGDPGTEGRAGHGRRACRLLFGGSERTAGGACTHVLAHASAARHGGVTGGCGEAGSINQGGEEPNQTKPVLLLSFTVTSHLGPPHHIANRWGLSLGVLPLLFCLHLWVGMRVATIMNHRRCGDEGCW